MIPLTNIIDLCYIIYHSLPFFHQKKTFTKAEIHCAKNYLHLFELLYLKETSNSRGNWLTLTFVVYFTQLSSAGYTRKLVETLNKTLLASSLVSASSLGIKA